MARVVGITLGTGIGSAFAVDGRIVTEGPGVPAGGELWDLPYEGGIIEDSVSTRGIRGGYKRRTGVAPEVAEIAAAAASDPAAAEAFAEFGRHLGTALRGALAVFAPEVIVLGGGISRSPHLFLPAAQRELDGLHVELRVSELVWRGSIKSVGATAPAVLQPCPLRTLLRSNRSVWRKDDPYDRGWENHALAVGTVSH